MREFWKEMFTSHRPLTGAEDVADSIALMVIMGLVCLVIFI